MRTLQKTVTLKTLFDINTDTGHSEGDTLLIQIGADHFSYATWDAQAKTVKALKYFTLAEPDAGPAIAGILGDQRNRTFKQVFVCSAFPYALITPQKLFKSEAGALKLLYDHEPLTPFYDTIPEWQVVTEYAVAESIVNQFMAFYPGVKFIHAYTPALRVYNGFTAEQQLSVHFTTRQFQVILKKGGHLQLAQTYTYKTPLDVTYYLLKICYEFGLDQSQLQLIISGLVEQDSALYKELNHYFMNIHFAQATEGVALPQHDYPLHFFTSLSNLAACV